MDNPNNNNDDDLFNFDLDSIFEDDDHGMDSLNLDGSLADVFSSVPELTRGDGDALLSSSFLSSSEPFPRGSNNNNNNNDGDDEDSSSTTPQLVTRSNRTSIYRSQDKGIKIIDQHLHLAAASSNNSTTTMQSTLQKLLHEETVSKLLPAHCNRREVIEVGSFNNSPALFFKWENGITVEEWVGKVQQIHPQVGVVDFNVRLRAAMAIAKTLSQFHSKSVAYNALAPKNIVLMPFEGDYVAKFIDLSDAVVCNDVQTYKDMTAVDLKSFGRLLDQLFQMEGGGEGGERSSPSSALDGGDDDVGIAYSRRVSVNSEDEGEVAARSKRGRQRTPGEGLPLYLGTMISTLLISGDDDNNSSQLRYESANDVYEDLKSMLSQHVNNRRSSKEIETNHDDAGLNRRLKIPTDLFYGRQVQMSMIMHLLQSSTMIGDQPLMALIAGYAGTGKSTLVNQIKKPLAEKNGCFIEGKFDILSAHPDKVLASALDSFFANINASNVAANKYMSMRWRISDAIGSGANCLFDAIPSLRKFMTDGNESDWTDVPAIGSNQMGQRMKFMFCKLISAISCRSQPLVLVLDDLQWADETTLSVIKMLMTDPDVRHFLFLGCYRENEVNESHMLSANLNDLRERGINFMTVKVGPIEKESVNALFSDIMCLPPNLCRPLSTVVHQMTGGIIMFILRLLTSLNDEGLVWYSMSSNRWMFDLEKIEMKELSEDVVQHMTEHMSHLPRKIQMGLKLCACLGPSFDAAVLEKARQGTDIGDDFLESCVDHGFLQAKNDSTYTWSHDQIQQAAYELIPLQQREKFHLLIGSRLFLTTSPVEMNAFIFCIVDNINRGSNLLVSAEQKYEVATLNLKAGEKVLERHNFHSSAKYLMAGIALLENDSWEKKYTLTIRLYDAASEVLYATGNFLKLTALAEKPLLYARCFEDKLNIYNNLVRALSSSGKNDECIDTCVSVLSQLGESLPSNITPEIYREEVAKVKEALAAQTRQDLLSLPIMTDTKKLATMRFLNHMLIVTYARNPSLNPILVFRMVRMTVKFGVCNMSAIAFACYGAWLASFLNKDYEGAFRMGRVGTDLMKKLDAAEILPRIHLVVYGMINIYKEPWQASLCKYSEAYDAGMISGDMEYAAQNINFHYMTSVYGCGSNLKELDQDLEKHMKRAIQYQQYTVAKNMAICDQLTFDLMGVDKNAYEDLFGGLNEDGVIELFVRENNWAQLNFMYQKIKYVKYMCGDMDEAAKYYDLFQGVVSITENTGRGLVFYVMTFIDGLIALYFARKHGGDETKWTKVAEKSIESLNELAQSCSWNYANKLYLLQAEYYFLKDDERAYACYKRSIKKAREHRFNHEEGLANEKLATYLLHKSKHAEALQYFKDAKKCYSTWGATVLEQRIEKAITVLSPLCIGDLV